MAYQIQIVKSALKQLSKIEKPTREKIRAAIRGLAENPRPFKYKKLVDEGGLYRIKVGDYRIIYEVQNNILLVSVLESPSATKELIKITSRFGKTLLSLRESILYQTRDLYRHHQC